MDYSGHWLLILLGFALFAMVGSGWIHICSV
jgi:hypothetical protein